MATELKATTSPQDLIEDYRHGFHDSEENYVFKSAKGLTREIVERISDDEGRARVDARLPPQSATRSSVSKPMPTWGDTALLNEIDFDNIHYFVKLDRPHRTVVGRRPRRHQEARSTASASPKPSASSCPASRRSTSRKSSITPSSRSSKKTACSSATWIPPLKQYPEIVQKYFATVIPAARQQVRRAQLAPCGRAVRSSTCRRASK